MADLITLLEELCQLPGPSGDEGPVRECILRHIDGHAEYRIDPLGNIIADKRGCKRAARKIMVDAHMDEVGLVVTGITTDGFLRFDTLGGIDPRVLLGRRVLLGETAGVIGCVPVHLLPADQRNSMPGIGDMAIDIGAADREDALSAVSLGDTAVFDSPFVRFGDGMIKAKAIDDRAGCAILISLLCGDVPYDFTATFTVQEENGLVGARAAAYSVAPDAAIVLESTTAADLSGVPEESRVCRVGQGPVVSMMDLRTIYDRSLTGLALDIADKDKIPCQVKQAVAGGNNAGAIHASRGGVRTVSLSLPCRYLHSATCVIGEDDLVHTARLAERLLEKMAGEAI